jgi:hypothetical protein
MPRLQRERVKSREYSLRQSTLARLGEDQSPTFDFLVNEGYMKEFGAQETG